MAAPHASGIVNGYLARLEAETHDIPGAQRRELIDNVREHIAEARAALPDETDADLLNILDRLGDPAELAAEQSVRLDHSTHKRARAGLVEIGALILTPLFWPLGVILLWTSDAWNTRDKLIGTLIPPGGLFTSLVAFGLIFRSSCMTLYDQAGHAIRSSCSSSSPNPVVDFLLLILFLLFVLSPILTGIYMGIRLRRRFGREMTSVIA